jgi:hypothetical protein
VAFVNLPMRTEATHHSYSGSSPKYCKGGHKGQPVSVGEDRPLKRDLHYY